MLSFSGVTFVSFCFDFVFLLSLKPRPFVQSFFVLRYACAPTATRSYLTTACVLFSSCFFLFLFLWECRFFRVFLYHYRFLFVWRVRSPRALSLRNLVSGYECGRVVPAGVGPGSPSRDAANWLPSQFILSVETRWRYGWLRMVFSGAPLFRAPTR